MKQLSENWKNKPLSHIYVESQARNYLLTDQILARFPNSEVIEIKHYKDVFNRPRQDFSLQKTSPKLILAVQKERFIYPASENCLNPDRSEFYYVSMMRNCIFECDYCFLRGMYETANMLVFVNLDDYFSAVEDLVNKYPDKRFFIPLSYETDLLAFEHIIPFCRLWINRFRNHSGAMFEIRTKSANFRALEDVPPAKNVILSWSILPQPVMDLFEPHTPSLGQRLKDIDNAVKRGWTVRIAIDPAIVIENWVDIYAGFLDQVSESIWLDKLCDIHIGPFRMPEPYFYRIKKQKIKSPLYCGSFQKYGGVISYDLSLRQSLTDYIQSRLTEKTHENKIFILTVL